MSKNQIKVVFTGDIMFDSFIFQKYKEFGIIYLYKIFEDIKPLFNKGDLVIGNLETPVSDDPYDFKEEKFAFTCPLVFAKVLKDVGIDIVTTANNHCLDNDKKGIIKTINCLQQVGLLQTGISHKNSKKYLIVDVQGIKLGFLSYTYGTNAFFNNIYLDRKETFDVNLLQNQELSNWLVRKITFGNTIFFKVIRKICKLLNICQMNVLPFDRNEKNRKHINNLLKNIESCKVDGADFVVMCIHDGSQYNNKPQQRVLKNVSLILNEGGVDLVVGNHEHIISEVSFKEKMVAYALGDFLGTYGVIEGPFDKKSDYSILLNTYLYLKNGIYESVKYTITILKKVIYNGDQLRIVPLYKLIKTCEDENQKAILVKDNQEIVEFVCKYKISIGDIREEYEILNS